MASKSFNDDSKRIAHVVVISIFAFIALVAVILRLWARRIKRIALDLSDYLIIVGLIWALATGVFTIYCWPAISNFTPGFYTDLTEANVYWYFGAGNTQIDNPEANRKFVTLQGKSVIVGPVLWAVAVFFIRASVIALYIQVFPIKLFRITCFTIHAINAGFLVSIVLASCLICRPISFIWDHDIPGGMCGDQKSLDLYIGSFNLLMDITVVVLPMPVLWGLQMAVTKKLVLSGMFGLGIVYNPPATAFLRSPARNSDTFNSICVLTLIRIKITTENHGTNAQSVYSLIALFTCLEALLGVLNACLPVLKPILTKFKSSSHSGWLASVVSGSFPIFMRRSQLSSNGRSRTSTNRNPEPEKTRPKELPDWPSSYRGEIVGGKGTLHDSPSSVYLDDKPANVSFGSRLYHPIKDSPSKTTRPPVPPKDRSYSPMDQWETVDETKVRAAREIYVQKGWDIERG